MRPFQGLQTQHAGCCVDMTTKFDYVPLQKGSSSTSICRKRRPKTSSSLCFSWLHPANLCQHLSLSLCLWDCPLYQIPLAQKNRGGEEEINIITSSPTNLIPFSIWRWHTTYVPKAEINPARSASSAILSLVGGGRGGSQSERHWGGGEESSRKSSLSLSSPLFPPLLPCQVLSRPPSLRQGGGGGGGCATSPSPLF